MGKSTSMKTACYAKGGAVQGKVSEFMKTDNEFTSPREGRQGSDEAFGKEGPNKGPANPKPSNKQVRKG